MSVFRYIIKTGEDTCQYLSHTGPVEGDLATLLKELAGEGFDKAGPKEDFGHATLICLFKRVDDSVVPHAFAGVGQVASF